MRGQHLALIKKPPALLTTSSMLLPAGVLAQGEPVRLAPVTVSGEKLERESVTTNERIRKYADQDIQDAMVRTPGVYASAEASLGVSAAFPYRAVGGIGRLATPLHPGTAFADSMELL